MADLLDNCPECGKPYNASEFFLQKHDCERKLTHAEVVGELTKTIRQLDQTLRLMQPSEAHRSIYHAALEAAHDVLKLVEAA